MGFSFAEQTLTPFLHRKGAERADLLLSLCQVLSDELGLNGFERQPDLANDQTQSYPVLQDYVPVLFARLSYRREDIVETLDRVCRRTGYPKTIRVDEGSQFISRDMDLWAYQRCVTLDFSRPGKPTVNAFFEAFDGRFRAECLNAYRFLTLADASEKMETSRRHYNEERPLSAIGNKAPITLTKSEDISSMSP